MGVLQGTKPRADVLKGDLDDAIFAADFGAVVEGKAPRVYGDPEVFFKNTHPAKQLKQIVQAVFSRLASTGEAGATIRLSTGFGGGKTHTLIALWHLARNLGNAAMGTDLLPAARRPKTVTVVGIDASKAGVPQFSAHGSIKPRSLWGEFFYQLGGKEAYARLGEADDPAASPREGQIEAAFPKGPVLILLDELVVYMARLSEPGPGNLLGFLNSLLAVVNRRKQTVLVITDPASQVAYAEQSAELAKLQHTAQRLRDVADRWVTDFDPIGDESAQVIVSRLFESVDSTAAQQASAAYHALYERVNQEHSGMLPPAAASGEYADRIVQCYPFHPRLLDTATQRLGAIQAFQKSRGVLRLFARILRDIWEPQEDSRLRARRDKLELITAGEIDWTSGRITGDLLDRIQRIEFRAAIDADIKGHAAELDGDGQDIHRRVASAILLESLQMTETSGLEPADLTLAVLRPDEAGNEPVEAMERLVGVCWHTYPTATGRGCQFRYEPNVLRQIEEKVSEITLEDARHRLFAEAQEYFKGMSFELVAWPDDPRQVPRSPKLQLALCESEDIARKVVAFEDIREDGTPVPREYQNVLFAVTARPDALNEAIRYAQRLMAAEKIRHEHSTGRTAKLVRDQLQRIMPKLQRDFGVSTRRAFDRVVLPGGSVKPLDERYQVSEDEILKKPYGQGCLKRFLEEKGLMYKQNDALDVDRFVKEILRGTVPVLDQRDVYTAQAIHERFLTAPGLRLIPDGSIVRRTILRAVEAGRIVVRAANGTAYDREGCVAGPEGRRQRTAGSLTSFPLDDTVLITPADSPAAAEWLKETQRPSDGRDHDKGGDIPPPPPPPKTLSEDPGEAIAWARERAMLELKLRATSPSDAKALLPACQPLGAERLRLSVTVGGDVKAGGTLNFAADDLAPNHPVKPLEMAERVWNALDTDRERCQYEVSLSLWFGQNGRTGLGHALNNLFSNLPESVTFVARFAPLEEDSA